MDLIGLGVLVFSLVMLVIIYKNEAEELKAVIESLEVESRTQKLFFDNMSNSNHRLIQGQVSIVNSVYYYPEKDQIIVYKDLIRLGEL